MKVLCGGPTRETDSLVFQAHREGLEAQENTGVELEIRHEVVDDPGGPRWHLSKIERVAEVRQTFLEACLCDCSWVHYNGKVHHGSDCSGSSHNALFMVDSDVILGPGVLERLWRVDAPVVYGVYWTYADWGGSMAQWPQVWDLNPYGWTQETADALREEGVNEVEVLGGGACTLIRGRGFESHYFPLLESLKGYRNMWAGEDRTYCLGLETRGIRQVAVTGLPIHHCYDLSDQTRPALARIRKQLGLEPQPEVAT